MTVKELIDQESGNYTTFEVWAYTTKRCRVHTDFIENIDSVFEREAYENIEVDGWELMDEREYNRTICANCSDVSFEELYDDADAKVLVMMLTDDWNHHQLWYALLMNEEDADWGTGTFDRDEAIKRMLDSEGYYTVPQQAKKSKNAKQMAFPVRSWTGCTENGV